MKKVLIFSAIIALVSGFSYSYVNNVKAQENININSNSKIKNVIMFIGDGMGPTHVDAAGIYQGEPLCFDVTNDKWTYHAYSNTDSLTSEGFTLDTSKSLIHPEENPSLYDVTPSPYSPEGEKLGISGSITTYTDSAAGGSALACGEKFTNSRIGMDVFGNPVENLVEIAHGLNKKTGVVTSDTIVGATPSDFLVHVGERHLSDEIIRGVATSKADLVLAKTDDAYINNQSTYETLLRNNNFDISYDRNSLNKDSEKIFGLFKGVMPKDDPRAPSLKELTAFALDYLDNDEGFFLMVEGANIDKKSHSNLSKLTIDETLGFNEAVKTASLWADNRDDTLILVTADHETGGLYYNRDIATKENIVDEMKWLSTNHSRTRVDIAIYGDISDFTNKYSNKFSTLEGLPYWDNTDVFKFCSYYLV